LLILFYYFLFFRISAFRQHYVDGFMPALLEKSWSCFLLI